MSDDYKRPYVESSVFLGFIKDETVDGVNRGEIAEHIFTQAEAGKYRIYTSTIALAEVHKLRRGPILPDDNAQKILDFFEREMFEWIDVDRGIGEEAFRLCRDSGIYPMDAIHLASALRAKCDVFLAWDDRVTRCTHPDIRTEEPEMQGQLKLALNGSPPSEAPEAVEEPNNQGSSSSADKPKPAERPK